MSRTATATAATGTLALPTGSDGEFEEHDILPQQVEVTDDDLRSMAARRRASHVSLRKANRARAALGLPPLGKIEQDRRQTVYRVPAWGR